MFQPVPRARPIPTRANATTPAMTNSTAAILRGFHVIQLPSVRIVVPNGRRRGIPRRRTDVAFLQRVDELSVAQLPTDYFLMWSAIALTISAETHSALATMVATAQP